MKFADYHHLVLSTPYPAHRNAGVEDVMSLRVSRHHPQGYHDYDYSLHVSTAVDLDELVEFVLRWGAGLTFVVDHVPPAYCRRGYALRACLRSLAFEEYALHCYRRWATRSWETP